jgi:hypothetical protein
VGEGSLADYYFLDPRVVLVPVEHLSDAGMSRAFAGLVRERAGWTAKSVALFDEGWRIYWTRSADLARRTRTWPAPRRRHVAVVAHGEAVRPWVQLLNTGAWLVYACDVDPATSHAELLAYLLALGDRMAATGEIAPAPVLAAAWWLERSDEECEAFADATARSTRPDASALAAVADALPWLRALHHEALRPPPTGARGRAIPGSGLTVPASLEAEPPRLVARFEETATHVLARWHAAWRRHDAALVENVCEWLAAERPPVLVTAERGRIVWDPEEAERTGGVRSELKRADAVAVERVHRDLERIAEITRRFFAAVVDPTTLAAPAPDIEQSGYAYLHATRRLVAYNLREPGMERCQGPPLPYEHAMVGARTAHEWAHVADAAGYVPRIAAAEAWAALRGELATALDDAVAAAPATVRRRTEADLAAIADGRPLGVALGRLLVTRMPDWRANLVARRLVDDAEAETYVRHNVRALGAHYRPETAWRLLLRYLFEYQYLLPSLGLTRIDDPRDVFFATTGIERELIAPGVVDDARFDALAAIVGRLCTSHAIDPTRLRFA